MVERTPKRKIETYTSPLQILDLVLTDQLKGWQSDIVKKARSVVERGIDLSQLHTLNGIVIPGASMEYNQTTNDWEFNDIISSDPSRLVGGHFRITAAQTLYKQGFHGDFIVTGGVQQDPSGRRASKSDVLADKIRERTVPVENVISIGTESHGNTQGNVQDFISYLKQSNEGVEGNKYGLLTSIWQMPRALIFFLSDEYFDQQGIEFYPLIADAVRMQFTLKASDEAHAFAAHPEMEERVRREVQGIMDSFGKNYVPLTT
jgi:hypothetical protein